MTYTPSDRLSTRLPPRLWKMLFSISKRWGLPKDEVVRRLIEDAGREADWNAPVASQAAPGSTNGAEPGTESS